MNTPLTEEIDRLREENARLIAELGKAEPVAWIDFDRRPPDLHLKPTKGFMPVYAHPPAQDGVMDFLRECEQEAEHIEQNGSTLRVKFGEDHEGRCRELCAMYLREFLLSYRMKQKLDAAPTAAPEAADTKDARPTHWLIYFDDNDRKPEIYTNEKAALYRYEQISVSWNAHLFVKINSNSRDAYDAAIAEEGEKS